MTDYQDFTSPDTPKSERRRLGVGDIYANQAKCLRCGDIIRSKNRHDMARCSCKSLAVDGGSWMLRRAVESVDDFEEMSIPYDDVKE